MADPAPSKKVEDAIKLSFELMRTTAALKEAWITRYITITAALVSAIAAIVSFLEKTPQQVPVLGALIALGVIGMMSNVIVTNHIMRLSDWEIAHGDRFRELEKQNESPSVFVYIDSNYPPLKKSIPVIRYVFSVMWLVITLYFLVILFQVVRAQPA